MRSIRAEILRETKLKIPQQSRETKLQIKQQKRSYPKEMNLPTPMTRITTLGQMMKIATPLKMSTMEQLAVKLPPKVMLEIESGRASENLKLQATIKKHKSR